MLNKDCSSIEGEVSMQVCAMKMRKITAIFQESMLKKVEAALCDVGVVGFTLTSVAGCGEYKNFYGQDQTTCHARIEIFIEKNKAEEVAQSIVTAAHIGLEGDGIVAISPVEELYRIRTKSKLTAS